MTTLKTVTYSPPFYPVEILMVGVSPGVCQIRLINVWDSLTRSAHPAGTYQLPKKTKHYHKSFLKNILVGLTHVINKIADQILAPLKSGVIWQEPIHGV